MPRTVVTVAIFHQEIIARVATRKAKNIVPLSPIRNFFCTSKHQKTNIDGIIITSNESTNSLFSLETREISVKYSLIVSTRRMRKDVSTSQDVSHGITSLQLIELKTKTYQEIVKISGIIKILYSHHCRKYSSSLITQPKILLIYQILILVIQIMAQIHICITKRKIAGTFV